MPVGARRFARRRVNALNRDLNVTFRGERGLVQSVRAFQQAALAIDHGGQHHGLTTYGKAT